MTEKLYEKSSYIRAFKAKVAQKKPLEDKILIALDKTAFFPEGGGQPGDIGFIGEVAVEDTVIENGVIWHTVKEDIAVGQEVECAIDWDVRFSRMQNHTAEHLLCGIIHEKFGFNNVGFHLNDHIVTMDIDGALTGENIAEVEALAQKAIYENCPVFAYTPSKEELKELEYRSKLELDEDVRIVEIDGYDRCACCAPHVMTTSEIGVLKVINFFQLKKGVTRIELLAGNLAYLDYKALNEQNSKLMALLSAKRMETFEETKRASESLTQAKNQIKELSAKLAFSQIERLEIGENLVGFLADKTYDDLRYCCNILTEEKNICCLFSEGEKGEYIYLISSKETDVTELVKSLNSVFSGRGGGKKTYAQGKLTGEREELIAKLKELM